MEKKKKTSIDGASQLAGARVERCRAMVLSMTSKPKIAFVMKYSLEWRVRVTVGCIEEKFLDIEMSFREASENLSCLELGS